MTNIFTQKSIRKKFITSAGALALIAVAGIAMAPQAYAQACTNGTGAFTVQCGAGAAAHAFGNSAVGVGADAGVSGESTYTRATALGSQNSATGVNTTAIGASSHAGINGGGVDDATAIGALANAIGEESTAVGKGAITRSARNTAIGASSLAGEVGSDHKDATAIGHDSFARGEDSTALGKSAVASGHRTTAIGMNSDAGILNGTITDATALGWNSLSWGSGTIAIGAISLAGKVDGTIPDAIALGTVSAATGDASIAIGKFARAEASNSIAIGSDSDGLAGGAKAQGLNSIAIGADANDRAFANVIVIGKSASATEAGQVVLKSADTFTILGNGDVGIGTAAPLANLDINSGFADTTLLLNNSSAQWELKSKASTGRLNFKNITDGGVPFKLGPNSVNGLLSVGTMADDLVEVRGELMVEGDVDVTGTLTTGGPTCGGGCDAVFAADYDLPSIEEHAAQMYANSYLPEIGPTVPKAAINVSERMGTMLNELEKAHIYIAQNHREKQQMQRQINQQAAELAIMKQQIALLMNP